MRAPVFFIGHGSPMNAIQQNAFTHSLKKMREIYPNPKAILCISAHWMTEGTWITHMKNPKTVHDFYGFPEELFNIQYPAPGSPDIAEFIKKTISDFTINLDDEMWGLDHGTWSVLRHIFPEANIPVLQLSLHMEKPPQYHYELGKKLKLLRNDGILIVGSGNIVHNLGVMKGSSAEPYDWAIEYDELVKNKLLEKDYKFFVNDFNTSESGKLSIPTNEHYYPFLYSLGASDENDRMKFEFEGIDHGSVSMRTISFIPKSIDMKFKALDRWANEGGTPS